MKRYSLLTLVLSVNLAVGCGTKKQNTVPTIYLNENQVLFTANEYGKFNKLYSIDLTTRKFTKLQHINASSDAEAYQINDATGKLKHFYHVEKFSGTNNTRVTNYMDSQRQNENINFPRNTRDLIHHKGKLIGIGYDDQKIIMTDLELNEEMPATFITGLEIGSEKVSLTNKNISSILIANKRVFVVSGGSYRQEHKGKFDKMPKIYLLNKDLSSVEKSWTMQHCFNAFSMQHVVNESQLLVSCNPDYGAKKNIPSIILIDAESINIESTKLSPQAEKKLLSQQYKSPNNYLVSMSGISQDKKSVFITEYSDWQVVKNSYWYNIKTGEISYPNNVAGYVTYNKKNDSYLFSCYLVAGTCVKDKFVLAKDMNGTDPELIDVKIQGVFSGFAKVLN